MKEKGELKEMQSRLVAQDKLAHVLLVLAIAAITVAVFWIGSRYPNLQDKAMMGGAIVLQDPLSFEARFELDPTWGVLKRIWYTTLNWIYTNRRGMMFGVLFGSVALTAMGYLRHYRFRTRFTNAVFGALVGAPLGVCVNCAAPIGLSLYRGGVTLETALAAMIASPTLNVVVLSMAFALLPFHVAVIKLLVVLILILIVVPYVCSRTSHGLEQNVARAPDICEVPPTAHAAAGSGNNVPRPILVAKEVLTDLARNMWTVSRLSVPLMLLSAILGATVATLFPFEELAAMGTGPLALIVAALLGTFAPVPMAFDVVLCSALLQAGSPIALVGVLACSLGSYSIYSFLIVSRMTTRRLAGLLAAAAVVLSLAGGFAAGAIDNWQAARALELLKDVGAAFSPVSKAKADGVNAVSVKSQAFSPRSAGEGTLFGRNEAWKIGIDRPNGFNMRFMYSPFYNMPGSISAADLDNDDDQDIVMSDAYAAGSILVFKNDGKGMFTEHKLTHANLQQSNILSALPFDPDNDGWVDLFVATARHGNFIWMSNRGEFSAPALSAIKGLPDFGYTQATGFGDINGDGFVDIALGNAEGTRSRMQGSVRAGNQILLNDKGRFHGGARIAPDGRPGDTLVVLLADINGDGHLDYAEANESIMPDYYFLGDGKGGLKRIVKADGFIPLTTNSTMSIRSADLDNDGNSDLLMTQIAGRSDGVSSRLKLTDWGRHCDDIERPFDAQQCQRNLAIRSWYRAGFYVEDLQLVKQCLKMEGPERETCKALILRDLALRRAKPELCNAISETEPGVKESCQTQMRPLEDVELVVDETALRQVRGRNILLKGTSGRPFEDVSASAGIEVGGWSWDTEIADFDNDGLQDVFIANGEWSGSQDVLESKTFFRNLGNLRFKDETTEAGVEDYAIVPSTASADFDNDGDIDMISNTVNGPVLTYWNRGQSGNAIIVGLVDERSNRFGIGSRITIAYGETGAATQFRDVQLSGGFNALDSVLAHFGLGKETVIKSIKVRWSTGEEDVVHGPFAANQKITLTRHRVGGN